MTNEGTIKWKGKSGKEYPYNIHKLDVTHSAVPANYVFTRITPDGTFAPIYVGETGDISERFDWHHKWDCIVENEVSHICTHRSSDDPKIRQAEEQDIIYNYSPTCND